MYNTESQTIDSEIIKKGGMPLLVSIVPQNERQIIDQSVRVDNLQN